MNLTQENVDLHQIHIIGFNYFNKTGAEYCIRKALKKFGCTSALLSIIHMEKMRCITKEKYETMYKTNKESEEREDLSVGEDLETFIGDIKMENSSNVHTV